MACEKRAKSCCFANRLALALGRAALNGVDSSGLRIARPMLANKAKPLCTGPAGSQIQGIVGLRSFRAQTHNTINSTAYKKMEAPSNSKHFGTSMPGNASFNANDSPPQPAPASAIFFTLASA